MKFGGQAGKQAIFQRVESSNYFLKGSPKNRFVQKGFFDPLRKAFSQKYRYFYQFYSQKALPNPFSWGGLSFL